MYHGANLIKHFIPSDHSRQVSSKYFIDLILKNKDVKIVMDLGCGDGNSIDYFRKVNPKIKWIGVDVQSSPEFNLRLSNNTNYLCIYDGVRMPFKDNYFDLIYCNQVFEHVQKPYELIREISRAIRPLGYFVGSISYLEPFHSLSICNFTPYGFSLLLKENSFELIEIRPGIDSITLLLKRLFGRIIMKQSFLRAHERESFINTIISVVSMLAGKSHQDTNLIKLLFCGQYRFIARKI